MFNGKGPSGGGDGRESMTLVGGEASFHGILTVKGSVRIEGLVEGDVVDAVSVEVGKGGRVKGNISAETLSIAGSVSGDVVASRSIELLKDGRLSGSIRTPSLRIEEGARFDGQCSMAQEGEPVRAQRPEPVAAN